MLIVQRTSKHSVQIKEESSFSSSVGRMPLLQASMKILSFQESYVPTDETSRLSSSTYTLSFVLCIRGQDAHRAKNQQTFSLNKRRIILFIISGLDARPASINEDFKTSLQPCAKQ
ncbi:hypothetical protein HZH68_014072 [Vespula germanica]|uniref:Uncharacterized protein n=1 Tax=Vespula germanica TaxID=30212 RepID=A0A834JAH6_VESGE|nr:hypothetical protein HZH68_014072 [Vespula germanica]